MLNRITSFFPAIFLIVLWVVFAYPYIFQGKVPFPASYQVNHFHPWSLDQKNWGPVKNGAMPDVIDQIYPWKHFTVQELKDARLPWWNPNSFSGTPHIANVQSAAFTPMNLLFIALPFLDAWSLLIFFQPIIAAAGMYLLLRFYKISKPGALLGSVSWMFSGFIVVWMAYGTLSMAIAILPLLLFCLNKCFASRSILWGIAGTLLVATSFFSGHFQTSLYLFLVSLAYCLFLFISTKEKVWSLLTSFFVFFGLIIALIQVLPAVQFYNLSPRSDIFIFSGGIPIHYLVTLFAPDFFGNPVTRNDWFGFYAEWSSFVGIVPFIFAFFTIGKKKSSLVYFFQILSVVSLLFAVESPLLKILGNLHIPVLSTSTPSRLIVICSFSLAVLAGFGYDIWRKMVAEKRFKRCIHYFATPGLLLVAIWAILFSGNFLTSEHAQIARKNLLLPSALYLGVIAVTICAIYLKKKERVVIVLLLIPLFFAGLDSVRFAAKWMPFDPRSSVFSELPVINAMQKEIGNGRVFGNIGAQVGTYYNLPIIEGYDPLYIDRYGEFIRTSATGKYSPSERSVVKIDRNGLYTKRVFDLLGVTLIYHPNADTNQAWAFHVWNDPDFEEVYRDDLYSLYKNTKAISRPSLYYDYEVIPDKNKLLTRFYTKDFDYQSVLLLEENPGISSKGRGKGSIKVLSQTPTSTEYSVKTDQEALLFLSDNYYPGWKAYVNGKKTRLFRADYSFRAVVVPKGMSIVTFDYQYLF